MKKEQIEQREDFLAEQEYNMSFAELPGDVKQQVHNTALEDLGLRKTFIFKCLDCATDFEEVVEGDLVLIYTDIGHEPLESVCPECRLQKAIAEAEAEIT